MEIEEAIATCLKDSAAVSALVGDRVFPGAAAQREQMPYLTYEEASRQRLRTIAGGYVNLNSYLLHLDCWAATRAQAKAVRAAVAGVLDSYTGDLGGGAFTVTGTFHEDQDSDVDVPIHGEEIGPHRLGLDLSLWYRAN